jgi:hypothetical protein
MPPEIAGKIFLASIASLPESFPPVSAPKSVSAASIRISSASLNGTGFSGTVAAACSLSPRARLAELVLPVMRACRHELTALVLRQSLDLGSQSHSVRNVRLVAVITSDK